MCTLKANCIIMDDQSPNSIPSNPRVKATFRLRSETFSVNPAAKGALSEQLAAMKEESMSILKEFITKNNMPNDVPDEVVESGSEDETAEVEKPPERLKKRK